MDSESWTTDDVQVLDKILNMLKQQTFWNDYNWIVSKVQEIQAQVFKDIDDWNYHHQIAQVGGPLPSPLEDLQPVCDNVANVLFTLLKSIKQQILLCKGQENLVQQVGLLYKRHKDMLGTFLKRCLVIEKQPPHVIVRGTRVNTRDRASTTGGTQFNVSLRLLVNNQQFFPALSPPRVSCSLHVDDDVQSENSAANIENNEKTFKKDGDIFIVTLDKLKVVFPKEQTTATKRPRSGRASEPTRHVPELKSRLVFKTCVNVEGETFNLETFSVPVVVISNTGKQQVEAEGTIFWDNAFGAKGRQPFIEPDEVPFPQFGQALNYRWRKWNERELSGNQLMFLAKKLFPEMQITPCMTIEDLQNWMVSKQMFNKNKLPGCNFTFWEWFYETMKFVKDHMKDEWRDGLIEGFVALNDAEQRLQSYDVGTFMLRFSESRLGGISVAYKKVSEECVSMKPWTKTDLEKVPLAKCIRDIPKWRFLYPNSTPKEDVFQEIPDIPQPDTTRDTTRYPVKKRVRVEIDDGSSPFSAQFSPSPSQSSSSVADFSTLDQSSIASAGVLSPLQDLNLDNDPFWSSHASEQPIDDWFANSY